VVDGRGAGPLEVETVGAAFFVDLIAADTDGVGSFRLDTGTLGLVIGSLGHETGGVGSLGVETGSAGPLGVERVEVGSAGVGTVDVGSLGVETGRGSLGVETGRVSLGVERAAAGSLRVERVEVGSLGFEKGAVGLFAVKAAGERGVQRMILLPIVVSLVVGDGGTRAAGFFEAETGAKRVGAVSSLTKGSGAVCAHSELGWLLGVSLRCGRVLSFFWGSQKYSDKTD